MRKAESSKAWEQPRFCFLRFKSKTLDGSAPNQIKTPDETTLWSRACKRTVYSSTECLKY